MSGKLVKKNLTKNRYITQANTPVNLKINITQLLGSKGLIGYIDGTISKLTPTDPNLALSSETQAATQYVPLLQLLMNGSLETS